MNVVNPATGELIQELQEDTLQTIQAKFQAARRAQQDWASRPLEDRLGCLQRFSDKVQAEKEKLSRILTSEMGKPIAQARNEISALPPRIEFFLKNIPSEVGRPHEALNDPAQNLNEQVSYEPLGVIANISAWNYPWFVGSNVFVPALLTGNAVLYKPSEFASLTGLEIARLLHESGVPKDVFAPVIGTGSVGAEILKQPVEGVFFTGSVATGQKIARAAAEKMIRVQLELGGKDPTYVCDDVRVQQAAESLADGAFYNTGQSCCSVERIYVHEKIHDAFVEHFVKTVRSFVLGDPMDEKTYIGPLTRAAQIEVLEEQVRDARSNGATLLCGGARVRRQGSYFEPTVFTNVNHQMLLMREESFGPIIGIQKVKSDEEAISLMNDTDYGLTAGVYTSDRRRAEGLLARVNAGSAYWNCCDRISPRLPWTGRRSSGLGSTLGREGIHAFVQPKAWHLKSP